MHPFLINLQDIAILILFIASILYLRTLKLKKWDSQLSTSETIIYILTSIAVPTFGILYVARLLS